MNEGRRPDHGPRHHFVEHSSTCWCSRPPNRLLEAYLLLLIAEDPSHGYDLSERLDEDFFPHGYSPDEATVYRNLRRMEKEGLLVSKWDTEGAGHPRRSYEITQKGLETLSFWASEMEDRKRRLKTFLERYEAFKTRREREK
ncbi:MAG TPA: PadR family transcriptional regulator [Clostridia bacterium]|nr:PadR family transcriptional regulator [Clostridia bacterium]